MNTALAPDLAACQQAATDRYFKGSASLYQAFLKAGMAQFPNDVAAIEMAMASQDSAALRRQAHSLKTALGMLGFEAQKQQALKLELAAFEGDWPAATMAWHSLAHDLTHLIGIVQAQAV
ncbi:MAG: Hpt domain-containing protein [Comamonadaceae bacterium]|nr:Hpt domain-containing protein [Comamonadaceae bacterium]